jgi:molybdate transport system ATP-binding protein
MVAMAEAVNSSMLCVDILKKLPAAASSVAFQLQVAAQFSPGFTVIFGPSGAGKSTLLDCIAGITTPDAGTITLDNQIFFDAGKKIVMPPQQRRIGYVFQSLALFPHLTVRENIRFGIAQKPETEQRAQVEQTLRAMHIDRLVDRKPLALSGGEKQRVALARSLVTQPRLLLLDEPLTGLDAGLRQSILDDLREWNDANRVPIVYVTHNREEVDAIGERVVAIIDGHVRESGLPREVLDAPRTVALAQAAGFENLLSGQVVEHRPDDGVMRVALAGNHCELEVPLGSATVGSAVQIAIRAGDILLAREAPRGLSARNVLPGSVKTMEERGTLVVVQVHAGVDFEVHVTPGAVRALELRAGNPVWLVLKTHSCHVVILR